MYGHFKKSHDSINWMRLIFVGYWRFKVIMQFLCQTSEQHNNELLFIFFFFFFVIFLAATPPSHQKTYAQLIYVYCFDIVGIRLGKKGLGVSSLATSEILLLRWLSMMLQVSSSLNREKLSTWPFGVYVGHMFVMILNYSLHLNEINLVGSHTNMSNAEEPKNVYFQNFAFTTVIA